MRRLASLVLVLPLLIATPAHAQGTLVVSSNICALDKLEQLHQMTDSIFLPVAQQLVNEGRLEAAGSAYHHWGDEWNFVLWYTAKDIPTFLAAFDEAVRRVTQRDPDFITRFQTSCSRHKDSFYTTGKSTTSPPSTPTR